MWTKVLISHLYAPNQYVDNIADGNFMGIFFYEITSNVRWILSIYTAGQLNGIISILCKRMLN